MSNPVFWEKIKKHITNLSSAEFAQRGVNVKVDPLSEGRRNNVDRLESVWSAIMTFCLQYIGITFSVTGGKKIYEPVRARARTRARWSNINAVIQNLNQITSLLYLSYYMSRGTAFPTRLHVRLEKTEISMCVFSACASTHAGQSIRFPPEDVLDSLLPTKRPVKTDQTVRMHRLISLRWAHMRYRREYCVPAHMSCPFYYRLL